MATKKQFTIISTQNTNGQQDAKYTMLLKTQGGEKLKIDIRINSYDFQSHAKIEVWSETESKWNLVHALHYKNINRRGIDYSAQNPDSAFAKDSAELLRVATEIIE